jgi:hypothetical protein
MSSPEFRFSLASPNIIEFQSLDSSHSEFGLLSVAEQCALDRKLKRFAETGDLLHQLDLQGFAWSTTLDAIIFFDALAAMLVEASAGENRFLVSGTSRLELLKRPLCYFEFKRDRDDYVSYCHEPPLSERESRHGLSNVLKALSEQFSSPEQGREITDALMASRLKSVLTSQPRTLFASSAGQSLEGGRRPEVQVLCRALVQHIAAKYGKQVEGRTERKVVNTFARSEIRTWKTELEEFATVPRSLVDAPNCYPFVAVERFENRDDLLAVIVVSALDHWFVDERVRLDRRLPGISLSIFDISQSVFRSPTDFQALEEVLAPRLASLNHRITGFKRGQALANAAGDASKISRHWFGEGVASLLATDGGVGTLESEDVLDFWTRFVRDILCGRVQGVDNSETLPFDRAIIIRGAPSNAHQVNQKVDIRILEAAIESTAADSRFQHLCSMERNSDDYEDLNFASKKIKFATDLSATTGLAPNTVTLRPSRLRNAKPKALSIEERSTEETEDSDKETSDCDMVLKALFAYQFRSANHRADADAAESRQREARRRFNQQGLLFEYKNGIDLRNEVPFLHALNEEYTKILSEEHRAAHETMSWRNIERNRRDMRNHNSDSKIITISYDPTLIQANKRSAVFSEAERTDASRSRADQSQRRVAEGEDDGYVSRDEAFTLILIADVAPERGMHEILAERDDLKLLISLILSQRMRDRQREAQLLDRRVQVVEHLVEALMHKFRGLVPKSEQAVIEQNFKGLQQAIRFDRHALVEISDCKTSLGYLSKIWSPSLEAMDRATLTAAIRRYCDEHVIRIKAEHPVDLRIAPSPLPRLRLKLPLEPVKECLIVTLNNAIEAATAKDAPSQRQITIGISAFPRDEAGNWIFEIYVENSSGRIPADVWARLTSDEPVRQTGENKTKYSSTGIGVFVSRHVLRNGLGMHADIRYDATAIDRVCARIRLPARLDEDSLPPLVQEASKVDLSDVGGDGARSGMVLYVEDSTEAFDASVEVFHRHLPQPNICAVTTLKGAHAAIDKAFPALLVTDLSFPTDAGEVAKAANGTDLIESLAAAAADLDVPPPPIWVVSGNDRASVIKQLLETPDGGLKNKGYTLLEEGAAPPAMLLAGSLAILSQKRLGENSGVSEALALLGQGLPRQATTVMNQVPSVPHLAPELDELGPDVIAVPLDGDIPRAIARTQGKPRRSEIVVVAAPSGMHPCDAIARWFTLAPIADPNALGRVTRLAPVYTAARHHNVFLHIPVHGDLKLSTEARYWLLYHNVNLHQADAASAARYWAAMQYELKGPIALIRHDVRNIGAVATSPEVATLTAEIDTYSQAIEDQLTRNNTHLEKLEKLPNISRDEMRSLLEVSRNDSTAQSLRDALLTLKLQLEKLEAQMRPNAEQARGLKISCDALIKLMS